MRITSNQSFASTVIAAILWRLLNYSHRSFKKQNLPRLWCLPSDFLGKHIICNGVFERETMEYVARVLDICAPVSKTQSVFLDIGANVGNHTCFFAHRFALTIAVEPSSVVASILRSNVLLNDLWSKVTVMEAAFSEYSGTAMHYNATNDNLAGSSLDNTRKDTKSAIGKEVSVITGDEAVFRTVPSGAVIAFVKIDVEGHEYSVIQGLVETLRRDQPVLVFEADAGPSGQKCLDLLRQIGYCKFIEIVGDADSEKPAFVRFARRMISGTRTIEVREIAKAEPRYYEAILALPRHLANRVDGIQK